MKIEQIMSSPVITCECNTPIHQVATLMKEKNIGFIPIMKDNFLVGVVTDRDIAIRAAATNETDFPVETIMTPNPLTAVIGMDVVTVAKLMAGQQVRRIVITYQGEPVGVCTSKDLLKVPHTMYYVLQMYRVSTASSYYREFENYNPHDSIKIDDFPL